MSFRTHHVIIGFLLISILINTNLFAQSQRPVINHIPIPKEYKQAIQNGTRSFDGRPGANYWQQHTNYEIKTTLIPEANQLEGVVKMIHQNNSPDTLRSLHVDLDLNMHKEGAIRNESNEVTEAVTILNVRLNGSVISTDMVNNQRYLIQGTRLVIVPGTPIPPSSEVEIEIQWTLDIPQQGGSGRMGYDSGNVFYLGYWYPRMTVYDDLDGWHPDPFLGRAEFYHGFGNYSIEITAPGNWVIMSTGEFLNPSETLAPHVYKRYSMALESDTTINILRKEDFGYAATSAKEGTSLTWKFQANNVRDVAFSATRESFWDGARASVGDLTGDGNTDYTTVHSFYRESAPLWIKSVEYQQHSIEFLSNYTGFSYPWPHMTAVEADNIIGGGMEFPMMTVIGNYNRVGANALYSVTLHELAHMWIPLIVSTDERRYSWIDEGYTVFHTDAGKLDYIPNFDHREMTRQGYVRFALNAREGEMMRWSDFHYSGAAFGIASYTKPATILVALKGVLGDELFMKVHRELFKTWSFKLMSPYDLFALVESVSGQDLTWFWRSWYFETWTMDQAVKGVRTEGVHSIITIQDKGYAPMPVHLTITLANGEVHTFNAGVDTWLNGDTEMEISVSYKDIIRVEIDKDRYFPDTDRSNNVWEKP
jgi:hypothetical protein